MFEAAEVGHRLSKDDFSEREPALHMGLLQAQRALRDAGFPVIVLVSGVEGAGKGEVVSQLNTWLDARGVQTHAFWQESDEEHERPRFWRYWRALPPRGTIGILFGSWYTGPIIERAFGRIDDANLDRECLRIEEFERMLSADGALVVKLWFHLSRAAQAKRLEADRKAGGGKRLAASPLTKKYAKRYEAFVSASERSIRHTDTGACPWHIVESDNRRYRDMRAGEILLEALQSRLADIAEAKPARRAAAPMLATGEPTVLDTVDLAAEVPEPEYKARLQKRQGQLRDLGWKLHARGRNVVAVFEGWDAGGKGGAIRRVMAGLDARLYRVISVAAPTDEEKAQHYLWRFWRHLPRAGQVTAYDRSWYGRLLVERVERFATEGEWSRAYQEINDFEAQLTEHGVILLKFWLHISKVEQLRRFREREKIPWKQHKITDEDWRNRKRWRPYEAAVHDMVMRTSTEHAPWTLVSGNDKRHARLQVLDTFFKRLRDAL